MTAPRVRRPVLNAVGSGLVAAGLLIAACESPGPMQPPPSGGRRLYAAEGEEPQGMPRAKVDLREMVARYFPEVARRGVPQGESLYFMVSPEGEVVGHVRRALPRPSGFGANGERPPLTARDEIAALGVEPRTVRSIDYIPHPAGMVAPTPVNVVWVQLKGPGESPDGLRVASLSPKADLNETRRMLDELAASQRREAAATMRQPARATPDPAQLQAAVNRAFAPGMPGSGLRGSIEITYTIGDDGRARDVAVHSETPELVPVGRSIIESIAFPPSAAGKTGVVIMQAGPHLVPTRRP